MKFFWIFVSILLVGCATTPVMVDQAKPVPEERIYDAYSKYRDPNASNSQIVIVRDKGALGAAGSAALFVNGEIVSRIRTSEIIRLNVSEGDNVIGVGPGTKLSWEKDNVELIEQPLFVQPNKTYFYRITVDGYKGLLLQRTTQIH